MKKALIIDNDPISVKSIAHIIESLAISVKTAGDGIEALDILKNYTPDIITVDLVMPYLSGFELCDIIRQMQALKHVRLIIISATTTAADVNPAEYGADACLVKGSPDFVQNLIDIIKKTSKTDNYHPPADIVIEEYDNVRQLSKELLGLQYRMGTILKNIVEPLFEFTTDGKIIYVNESAVDLVGEPEHRILTSSFFSLFSKEHASRIRSLIEAIGDDPVHIDENQPVMLNSYIVVGRIVPFKMDTKHTFIAMLTDITLRKLAEEALIQNRASSNAIVEKSSEGIIVVDQEGIVLFINPAVEILFDREAEEIVGSQFDFPIIVSDKFTEIDIYRKNMGQGVAVMRSAQIVWENRPARLITLTDVTLRRQYEKKLQAAKIAADTANKAKSEFLANMSHELRSPLNAMLLLANELCQNKHDNLTQDQLESIQVIDRAGNSLLLLINDILDLEKIESGHMIAYISDMALCDLAGQINSYLGPIAREKKLEFEIIIDKDLPPTIRTDPQKLEQIIQNLVFNAVKFTSSGKVIVKFFKPDERHIPFYNIHQLEKNIAISVTDTGIGIPESLQKYIFEAFEQGDGSISRQYGGTGLGLSISKKLADLLGGHIKVKSTQEKGSIFTLYIPEELEQSDRVKNSRRMKSRPKPEFKTAMGNQNSKPDIDEDWKILSGLKALVVDEDVRSLFTTANMLESYGINVKKVNSEDKALICLEQNQMINFMLINVKFDNLRWIDLIRKIRILQRAKKLLIITLSQEVKDETREEFLAAGADLYITSPLLIEQLISALQTNYNYKDNDVYDEKR
ncbi:MAG: response regulator [Desulfobacteraceae bacterium]|nr:response regulator [Desulfobacteraceae bacterium]